jgi:hypothetical protein
MRGIYGAAPAGGCPCLAATDILAAIRTTRCAAWALHLGVAESLGCRTIATADRVMAEAAETDGEVRDILFRLLFRGNSLPNPMTALE